MRKLFSFAICTAILSSSNLNFSAQCSSETQLWTIDLDNEPNTTTDNCYTD